MVDLLFLDTDKVERHDRDILYEILLWEAPNYPHRALTKKILVTWGCSLPVCLLWGCEGDPPWSQMVDLLFLDTDKVG